MKKLLIATTLSAAAALTATSLFADPGHQRGPRQAGATENCAMEGQGNQAGRHAEMQARMQAMHAGMGAHEHRGQGSGKPGAHRGGHGNAGAGCPAQQAPNA